MKKEGEELHSVPVGPTDSRSWGSKRMLRSERWWLIKLAACLSRSRPDGTTGMIVVVLEELEKGLSGE